MNEYSAPCGAVAEIEADVPAECGKVSDRKQSSEDAVRQNSHENQIGHSLFILFHTAQKPAAAPANTRAALQNTPVLKARSSHRPTKAPSRIGPTMVQPKRPIIPSACPSGHSPVRNQCSRLRWARSTASGNSRSSPFHSRPSGLFGITTRGLLLLLRRCLKRRIRRPQIAVDLTNRGVFQPQHSRPRGLFGLDAFRHRRKDLAAQMPKVVAHNRFACRDFDDFAVADAKYAATNGDVMLGVTLVKPSHDADCERGQQVRMARFDSERTAGVLGANV